MSKISDEEWAEFQRGINERGIQASTAVATLSDLTDDGKAAANIELARAVLTEGAPFAAAKIVQLSQYASNERVQFDASKYIVERVLGPVGQKIEGAKGPLQSMLEGMFADAEQHANSEGAE